MQSIRIKQFLPFILLAAVLIFINIIANSRIGTQPLYTALDLTEEKRYSLTESSKQLLRSVDDVVFIRILLDGQFPAGFKRLQNATRDIIDDFRQENSLIEYQFDDPLKGDGGDVKERQQTLAEAGIFPVNLRVKDSDATTTSTIYPYAVVYYKGRQMPVNLLENQVLGNDEMVLNNSVALLEYKLADAILKLKTPYKKLIGFTAGHGELSPKETASLESKVRRYYETDRFYLDSVTSISTDLSALIIAKPTQPFSDKEKFKIDQYIMNGGKVLWLIDKLDVSLDSLNDGFHFPSEYNTDLDDLLFKYGVRLQPNLVLDLQNSKIPLQVGVVSGQPQFDLFNYPYHLVTIPASDHPIVKSVDAVNLQFASSIDTSVRIKTDVERTVLLRSSPNTSMQFIPVRMNFEFLRTLDPTRFDKGEQALALLLEGTFPSAYTNRTTQSMRAGLSQLGQEVKDISVPNKMIVVSDGDIAKSRVNAQTGEVTPLGFNIYERKRYSNEEFLLNALEYLIDDSGLIEARGKEIKLRLLDKKKMDDERAYWQTLNLLLPLLFLLVFGLVFNFVRNRKYK
ncbi:MAG: gliding motility-associated ABC transporter substrate-binding protein GldG [Bacteroidota bacterium]